MESNNENSSIAKLKCHLCGIETESGMYIGTPFHCYPCADKVTYQRKSENLIEEIRKCLKEEVNKILENKNCLSCKDETCVIRSIIDQNAILRTNLRCNEYKD